VEPCFLLKEGWSKIYRITNSWVQIPPRVQYEKLI
jgi:hypothetical protein